MSKTEQKYFFKGAEIGKYDANLTQIKEGDILEFTTKMSRGYPVDGHVVTRKVVYGQTSLRGDSLYDIVGFFLVAIDEDGFYDSDNLVKWYPKTFSIKYCVSDGAVIVGSIHKAEKQCRIYGTEITFELMVNESEIDVKVLDIWNNPKLYNHSTTHHHLFVNLLWVLFPNGKTVKLSTHAIELEKP